MLEATPGAPYGGSTADLRAVERNMAVRRFRIERLLPRDVYAFSLTSFPLLGAGGAGAGGAGASVPRAAPGGPFSRGAYLSDAAISPHPRFGTLTASIRRRRGAKVDIQVPLYRDRATRTVSGAPAVPAAAAAVSPSGVMAASGAAGAAGAAGVAGAGAPAPAPALEPLASVTEITDPRFAEAAAEAEAADAAEAAAEAAAGRATGAAAGAVIGAETEATRRFAEALAEDAAAGGEASFARAAAGATELNDNVNVGPAHVEAPGGGAIHMDAMAFGMGCWCVAEAVGSIPRASEPP